jgi:antirestriction protein
MKIYVGTYAKYNNGSIAGAWLDLSDYNDAEQFIEVCKELHKDEIDPELMFQDFDGIHKSYCNECIDIEEVYYYANACNGDNKDVIDAGLDCEIPLDSIMDAYQGEYVSDIDFAQRLAEETGAITYSEKWPLKCIDWDAAARELMFDYVESNGHYFNCHF